MLMHGYGASETDLAPLASMLDPDKKATIVFPRAPFAIAGGFAWFDLVGMFAPPQSQLADLAASPPTPAAHVVPPGFAEGLGALQELLNEECDSRRIDPASVVLGGFSQGATMALALALSIPQRPAGVLMFSSFWPGFADAQVDFTGCPPIFGGHGRFDPLVPIEAAASFAQLMHERGVPFEYHEYDAVHTTTPEELEDARLWLSERWSRNVT